jgi:hypothetical protein
MGCRRKYIYNTPTFSNGGIYYNVSPRITDDFGEYHLGGSKSELRLPLIAGENVTFEHEEFNQISINSDVKLYQHNITLAFTSDEHGVTCTFGCMIYNKSSVELTPSKISNFNQLSTAFLAVGKGVSINGNTGAISILFPSNMEINNDGENLTITCLEISSTGIQPKVFNVPTLSFLSGISDYVVEAK